jgi:phosphohistidine swiveling domain-containing protein
MPDATLTPPALLGPDDVADLDDASLRRRLGGKGRGLVLLARAGLAVPPFVIIPVDVVAAVARGAHDDALRATIRALGPLVAVRSSAVDEDGAVASFAGQHHTTLGARDLAEVKAAIAASVASFDHGGVRAYRAAHGLADREGASPRGAVVLQRLVEADVAGVAFSQDPDSGEDVVVIAACLGLGEGVVADRAESDTLRVDRAGRVQQDIADKTARVVSHDGHSVVVAVAADERQRPALDDDVARALADAVRGLAGRLGHAVDVEWTFRRDSGLAFVQVRAVTAPTPTIATTTTTTTTTTTSTKTATTRYLFDTSNIGESYPGVTAPLTWSHITLAYAAAYAESARLFGVADDEIADRARAFDTLLARIDGRVHYHLPSWCAVLALYPGYERNRAHMLAMMGADALDDDGRALLPAPPRRSLGRRLRMGWRLLDGFRRRHRLVADFHRVFEATIGPLERQDFSSLDAVDVVECWHAARGQLLRGWQAPLLADFLAMASHGRLRDFCAARGIDDVVVADLFAGADIPSVAPVRALAALARAVLARETLARAVTTTDAADALALLQHDDVTGPLLRDFLQRFGARAMHELKLEQPTWAEDPTFIARQVQDLVRGGVVVDVDPATVRARRDDAERVVKARLSVVERVIFARLVDAARTWTGEREAMRYARARAFAVLRRLALRLGDILVGAGHLDHRRDVFFLEHGELTGAIDGTATTLDLRGLVTLRRAEDARQRARLDVDAPDRVAFTGGVIFGGGHTMSASVAPTTMDGTLRGAAVVRGRARGRVIVVRSAADAVDVPGRVLVCPRTDPGFASLFVAAKALVIERGSPLSHCAIVARELGLPTLINVAGAASRLHDDDDVVVDADAGTVTLVGREAA